MDIPDLIKQLKDMKTIRTLVGEFSFVKQIGEGGNSNVCLYKKNDKNFAVKFFSKGTENTSKTKRFIDEYFGMAQIPSHKNIAEYLHLDTVSVNDESFFIIIMKVYKSALNETLRVETDESIYTDKLKSLYEDLLNAIEHLHAHGIIHRDIKPQNILIDNISSRYVLSDFGISKFDKEKIAKEADTKAGERLANYRYCAPEQRGKEVEASFSSDLYSFAQVIQEYATGDINHGGGRTQVKFQDIESLHIIDKVIIKCLMHNPQDRFKNVSELKEYMLTQSNSYKVNKQYLEKEDLINQQWDYLYKFDHAIDKGFPGINMTGEITDPIKMVHFFANIDETIESLCHKDNLWMVQSDGGDLHYYGAKHISGNDFLINYGQFLHEARITKIIVHYDDTRPYRSFFILLIDAMPHFNYVETHDTSLIKQRPNLPSKVDEAVIWNSLHLDPRDAQNRHIEIEGNIIEKNPDSFKRISRFIKSEAIHISPVSVFSYDANQHTHVQTLLRHCLRNGVMSESSIRAYWSAVGGHYSNWIASRR